MRKYASTPASACTAPATTCLPRPHAAWLPVGHAAAVGHRGPQWAASGLPVGHAAAVGHRGPQWAPAGHSGLPWATVGCQRAAVGHRGSEWAAVGHRGPQWAAWADLRFNLRHGACRLLGAAQVGLRKDQYSRVLTGTYGYSTAQASRHTRSMRPGPRPPMHRREACRGAHGGMRAAAARWATARSVATSHRA
jgi:hypothetical protein